MNIQGFLLCIKGYSLCKYFLIFDKYFHPY